MDNVQQPLPKHLITYLINRTHHLDGSRFTVISHRIQSLAKASY